MGGLERQLLALLSALAQDEIQHVLVTRGAFNDRPTLPLNVTHIVEPFGCDRAWSRRLALLLREYQVDLVHARNLSMLLDVSAAAELVENIRVAFSFHGLESARLSGSPLRHRVWRACIERADDRWAVSPSAARTLVTTLGLEANTIDVIDNGVDTTRYYPSPDTTADHTRLGLPMDRIIVACVGSLKPIKGHDILLDAIKQLGAIARGLTFVIAGRDESSGRLQHLAQRLPSDSDVRFIGPLSDPLPLYHAADLFVLPSRWEGLSNALLEAMSCGLPVIATAVGGNCDVLRDGITGLLVASESPAELAGAITRLTTNPELRTCLGRAARQDAIKKYDLRLTAQKYRDRYMSLTRTLRNPQHLTTT